MAIEQLFTLIFVFHRIQIRRKRNLRVHRNRPATGQVHHHVRSVRSGFGFGVGLGAEVTVFGHARHFDDALQLHFAPAAALIGPFQGTLELLGFVLQRSVGGENSFHQFPNFTKLFGALFGEGLHQFFLLGELFPKGLHAFFSLLIEDLVVVLQGLSAGGIEAFVQLGLHFFQQDFLLGKLLLQSTLSFGEGGQFFSRFVQMGAFSFEILFGRTQFVSKHVYSAIVDWTRCGGLFGFGQMHHARAKCDANDDSNNQADGFHGMECTGLPNGLGFHST